ncbi:hypothetical protein SH2C18_28580 [Clostridium sediminicola]|uniref:hypothetical protein n=1 Tax=Clostridium sediminicola TaxID=3114879 RepID=UPI0031F1F8CC
MVLSMIFWRYKLWVNIIRILVTITYPIIFIGSILIIYLFLCYIWGNIKRTNEERNFLKIPSVRYGIYVIIISFVFRSVFYFPKPIIPKGYTYKHVIVEKELFTDERFTSQYKKTISDKESIDKLNKILCRYERKRSLKTILEMPGDRAVKLKFLVYDKDGHTILIVIYFKDSSNMCSLSNTSFMNIINDDNTLFKEISDWISNL